MAEAKRAHEAQVAAMKDFLLAHIGQQLPLKGYASFAGFKHEREGQHPVWTMIPIGRLDAGLEDRKIRPGVYTICAVRDNDMVEFSWPGQEEARRTEASISQVRSATAEEIEAARVPKVD